MNNGSVTKLTQTR